MTSRTGLLPTLLLTLSFTLSLGACGKKAEAPNTTAGSGEAPAAAAATTKDEAGSSESGYTGKKACEMITAEEVSAIVGVPMVQSPDNEPNACTFNPNGGSMTVVTFIVQDMNRTAYDIMTKTMSPVSGIGDEAKSGSGSCSFIKGGKMVHVNVMASSDKTNPVEAPKKLAQAIVAKM